MRPCVCLSQSLAVAAQVKRGCAVSLLKVELGPRAFQMPQPWSRCISISKKGKVACLFSLSG